LPKKKDSDSDDEGFMSLETSLICPGPTKRKEESDESEKQTKVEGKKSNFNTSECQPGEREPATARRFSKKKAPGAGTRFSAKTKIKTWSTLQILYLSWTVTTRTKRKVGYQGRSTFEKLLKEEKKSERSVSPPDLHAEKQF
jgi:hypothetical protein